MYSCTAIMYSDNMCMCVHSMIFQVSRVYIQDKGDGKQTYISFPHRVSVIILTRICLTIAAVNDLKVLACDIQNVYLTALCRKKIYSIAGLEFRSDHGKIMIITRALY